MQDIFIGRQPIYDRGLKVVAYELLYRGGHDNRATFVDGDQATSEVLINGFMEFGLDTLVGRRPAFVNATRSFVTGRHPLPFSPSQVVLEILEDVTLDHELMAGLRQLADQGYVLALDDFDLKPGLEPLLKLANLVKLDLMALGLERASALVPELKQYGVKLVAEKVETHEVFSRCLELGFDYFQGYFLCRPNVLKQPRSPGANRSVLLSLLAKLQDPEAEAKELKALIVQDVSLTYRLLRYINSASLGLRHQVESVQRALVLIGTQAIKNWASLILLTRVEDKPQELMITALVRAKMCEQLARETEARTRESAFTVGLLSLLDAIMDRPMAELLEVLPLADELKQALLTGEGELGDVLRRVQAYERGDWALLDDGALSNGVYRDSYLEAIRWANEGARSLAATQSSGPVPHL